MDILQKIKVVRTLQSASAAVFAEVTSSLQVGMSEVAIAKAIEEAFQKKGIIEHWYTVPHNVLIGTKRFVDGLTTSDYSIKNPSLTVLLEEGSVLFIDMSPMDPKSKLWGDWSSTIVFRPRKNIDMEQIAFLKEFREIQRGAIPYITAQTTGAQICNYYLKIFKKTGITLLDVRKNVGHSLHSGPKEKAKRIWLDEDNDKPLGEGIFTLEPGGSSSKKNGEGVVIARFEDAIYIPKTGSATILL